MFSGIVTAIGYLIDVAKTEASDITACISTQKEELFRSISEGSSIACSGVCLTVAKKCREHFIVNISAETLKTTNLKLWTAGTKINLEPSLKVGDSLDGHIVQGHVDCTGTIRAITRNEGSHVLEILCDESRTKYLAYKGSVSVDGVSLTINNSCPGKFSVNVVPYTWDNTTLQYLTAGDIVNIETDLIARYLESLNKAAR